MIVKPILRSDLIAVFSNFLNSKPLNLNDINNHSLAGFGDRLHLVPERPPSEAGGAEPFAADVAPGSGQRRFQTSGGVFD